MPSRKTEVLNFMAENHLRQVPLPPMTEAGRDFHFNFSNLEQKRPSITLNGRVIYPSGKSFKDLVKEIETVVYEPKNAMLNFF